MLVFEKLQSKETITAEVYLLALRLVVSFRSSKNRPGYFEKMFLKELKIENDGNLIRNIVFQKGINLIVDETDKDDLKATGNSVGKTTVLRLIDYCLGGNGKNIYLDPEFKHKRNTEIEDFLKQNNIVITLSLKKDLDDKESSEIVTRRNFLSYGKKIQDINGIKYSNDEYSKKLKELIFSFKKRQAYI